MYYTVFKGTNGNWYWNLKAANHQIIANGEGYANKADVLTVIGLVKASSAAPIKEG